eukprot:GEMP01044810.1.p2 GENE.GEMP01044810.1~~GEMP01044810.1.p2  ORF type:complete len:109 (+),score=4.61 GEMP01044810.1:180-506(+)
MNMIYISFILKKSQRPRPRPGHFFEDTNSKGHRPILRQKMFRLKSTIGYPSSSRSFFALRRHVLCDILFKKLRFSVFRRLKTFFVTPKDGFLNAQTTTPFCVCLNADV